MQIETDTQKTEASPNFLLTEHDDYKVAAGKNERVVSVGPGLKAFRPYSSRTISLLQEQLGQIEAQLNVVNSHRDDQSPASLPNELLNFVAVKHQETIITLKNAIRELIR